MFVKDKKSGDLVEVLDVVMLIDPTNASIQGRFHAGEEMQDAAQFAKTDLTFPSGEGLPRCWTDVDYAR